MQNLVLYRKYRPAQFKDIIGQEHVVRTITNAIAAGEFAHSYLFAGPRGTGKTTIARLIAKSLNCENKKDGEYEPCDKCDSCGEITRGISPDIIEIDAASNRGIDEIRQLKEGIRFAPVRGKFKVFIVDEVHMLTKDAFNALLKTLEEPPSHAVFVLATTEINKVLPTIISRSQKFDLRKLLHSEIRERLSGLAKKEGKAVDGKILDIIASRATGSVRDAESILGQVLAIGGDAAVDEVEFLLGFADIDAINKFVNHLADNEKKNALQLISELNDKGVDIDDFIKNILGYLRWMMFLKTDEQLAEIIGREISKDDLEKLQATTAKFEMGQIQKAAQLFLAASNDTKYSPIPQLPVEMAVVELLSEQLGE